MRKSVVLFMILVLSAALQPEQRCISAAAVAQNGGLLSLESTIDGQPDEWGSNTISYECC